MLQLLMTSGSCGETFKGSSLAWILAFHSDATAVSFYWDLGILALNTINKKLYSSDSIALKCNQFLCWNSWKNEFTKEQYEKNQTKSS